VTSGPFLGLEAASRYVGISRRGLSRRLDEISHIRVGARVLFARQDLDAFLMRHRIPARSPRKVANIDRIVSGLRRGRG